MNKDRGIVMKNEDNHDVGSIETLETSKSMNDNNIKDIPTTFFRPIQEVHDQQTELLNQYHGNENNSVPDLSSEVRKLEKKLESKKHSMSFISVLFLVLIINLCWLCSLHFLIIPKYDKYVKQSEEIKTNYDTLKRKVDAIVGSE